MLGVGPKKSPLEEREKTWVKSREGAGPLGRRLAALGEMWGGRTKQRQKPPFLEAGTQILVAKYEFLR